MKRKEDRLVGIGGWLLFFVIIMGLSIIYMPIDLIIIRTITVIHLTAFDLLEVIISWLLILSVFILIFTKKRGVPTYAIIVVWFNFILGLVSFFQIKFDSDFSIIGFVIAVIITFVLSLGWAILFTLYFLKSKRVRNTFVR